MCIVIPFTLCMIIWLLWSQAQIARVLIAGMPATGTVVAITPCNRATAGSVTLVFTDVHGASHRVRHTSFTPGCFTSYHMGETLALRYIPGDAGVLMTQPKLDVLWLSALVFGMGDVLFVGGGVWLLAWLAQPMTSRLIAAARAKR